MADGADIARAALKQAQSKWSTYFSLLGGLMIALTIDHFTGRQFFQGNEPIKALGLTLPRAAFSITYTMVFAVIVLGQVSSARIVRTLCGELADQESRAAVARSAEVRLWTLSPLSASSAMRAVFWAIAAFGLIVQSVVTMAHLMVWNLPPEDQISAAGHQRIGYYCAAALVVSLWLAVIRIYPEWERTRAILGTCASTPSR